MSYILVIAEKPSVSQILAKVLGAYRHCDGYMEGNGYIVSWCLGHLAEYATPDVYDSRYQCWRYDDLPIIPTKWQLAVPEDKRKQFEVLKKLMNPGEGSEKDKFLYPVEYVVNACDAGREGELIFHHLYEMTGSRLPVKRLWISSMEEDAVRDGFANLKDGSEYNNLCNAAVCRAKADWLVGMNATRAYTTKYNKKLSVGRVQTPTLAMLAERQEKIDKFVEEVYYKVSLTGSGLTVTSEKINDEKDADELVNLCQGSTAVVSRMERVKKKSSPPHLYDLTTLQREANRFFGYTAQETLDILQDLYENKMVTYPRTDSQYITDDMEDTVMEILTALPGKVSFLSGVTEGRNIKRIINNARVSDHHALLPTKAAMQSDLSELSEKKRNIFRMISQRLMQAVSDDCIYEDIRVSVRCGEHDFEAKGRAVLSSGYRAVEEAFTAAARVKKTDDEQKNQQTSIPGWVTEGMKMENVRAKKSQHFTTPPKAYSEDTLLSAMETAGNKEFDKETEKKGLGTPATRASMIEKLVSSNYAVRKGKQITPTKDGMELTAVMPEFLKSASLTAEWENQLLGVERGEVSPDTFMQGIYGLISSVLNSCDLISMEEVERFHPGESIGKCPVCGRPVYETENNFCCSDRSCSFVLWKNARYLANMRKTIDKETAVQLLENGRAHMTGLYSVKKGSTFDADLLMGIEDGKVRFSLEFPKKQQDKISRNRRRR